MTSPVIICVLLEWLIVQSALSLALYTLCLGWQHIWLTNVMQSWEHFFKLIQYSHLYIILFSFSRSNIPHPSFSMHHSPSSAAQKWHHMVGRPWSPLLWLGIRETIIQRRPPPLTCCQRHHKYIDFKDKHAPDLKCDSVWALINTAVHCCAPPQSTHTHNTNTVHIWAMTQAKRLARQAHHPHLPSSSVRPISSFSPTLTVLIFLSLCTLVSSSSDWCNSPNTHTHIHPSAHCLGLDTKITPTCKVRGTEK